MTTTALMGLVPGIDSTIAVHGWWTAATPTDSYCLQDTKSGQTYYYIGGQSAARMSPAERWCRQGRARLLPGHAHLERSNFSTLNK